MAIENTSIEEELRQIFTGDELPVNSVWSCVIHVGDKTYKPHKVLSIDTVGDYLTEYGDSVSISLSLPRGMYNKLLVAEYTLVMELKRTPNTEANIQSNDPIYTKRYRAIPKRVSNSSIGTKDATVHDSDTMDLLGFETREFQLLDLAIEAIRTYQTGGIFRDTVPGDILKFLLTDVSNQLRIEESSRIRGVDMVKPDNTTPLEQTTIPHWVDIYNLPTWIQSNCNGIYSSDIGCYLQDGIWFVWPLYNTTRYNSGKKTLRVFNLPPNRYPGVERTYKESGNELLVLSTGESTHLDERVKDTLVQGSGTRFGLSSRFIDNFGTVSGNKLTVDRDKNTVEFLMDNNKTLPYAPVSADRITDNVFVALSRLSKRKGSIVSLVWESSKPELLYPGMPVKFHYLKDNVIKNSYGVLIGTQHHVYDDSVGPIQRKHKSNTVITIFTDT